MRIRRRPALRTVAESQRLRGVAPGAVTPLAVINDPEQPVEPILDRELLARGPINAHPLRNQAARHCPRRSPTLRPRQRP